MYWKFHSIFKEHLQQDDIFSLTPTYRQNYSKAKPNGLTVSPTSGHSANHTPHRPIGNALEFSWIFHNVSTIVYDAISSGKWYGVWTLRLRILNLFSGILWNFPKTDIFYDTYLYLSRSMNGMNAHFSSFTIDKS